MKRVLVCWMAIAVLVACGNAPGVPGAATVSASRQESPSAAPTVSTCPNGSLLPSAALSPGASIRVLLINTNGAGDNSLHLLTISGDSISDRPLPVQQQVWVLDANQRIALIATANTTQLALLDLSTAAICNLDVRSPGDIGPGVLSPDGSEAAVLVRAADLMNYQIDIVDLGSGASRVLLQVPASSYHGAGLNLLEWISTGILVSPGVWDGPRYGLLNLDPQSAVLTPLTEAQVDAVSPDATVIAAASHADLGDVPFAGQGSWPNRLSVGPVGGPSSVIAEQKNRAFRVLDVANDGSVIYSADDAPGATAPPAADMGLYLEASGHSIRQLSEARTSQYQAAVFIDQDRALVASQIAGGVAGTVEIDLVGLCTTDSACTVTTKPVETYSADFLSATLITLPS
jgi:hypothetical protein